jgi:hypothetical protein
MVGVGGASCVVGVGGVGGIRVGGEGHVRDVRRTYWGRAGAKNTAAAF